MRLFRYVVIAKISYLVTSYDFANIQHTKTRETKVVEFVACAKNNLLLVNKTQSRRNLLFSTSLTKPAAR